jgi:hypothetical protein
MVIESNYISENETQMCGKCQVKFEKFATESNCEVVIVNIIVVAVLGVVIAISLSVVRLERYMPHCSTRYFRVCSLHLDILNPLLCSQ